MYLHILRFLSLTTSNQQPSSFDLFIEGRPTFLVEADFCQGPRLYTLRTYACITLVPNMFLAIDFLALRIHPDKSRTICKKNQEEIGKLFLT